MMIEAPVPPSRCLHGRCKCKNCSLGTVEQGPPKEKKLKIDEIHIVQL